MKLRATCWILLLCAASACAFEDSRDHCSDSNPCGANQRCYKGFCLQASDVETEGENASGQGGSSGSAGRGTSSNPNMAAGAKSTGRAGNGGKGGSGGKPSNAADGGMTQANGSCTPKPEECNGEDDDCDGNVDEQLDRVCYPEGEIGCKQQNDQTWTCEGLCALGTATCTNGEYGECTGYTGPATEVCTPTGMLAADEDCNGKTDETCSCTPGEMRSCYNGRAGTLNVGKCVAGTQTCMNGSLGACMGAVIPSTETCANQGVDDDCDGMQDNILNLGTACVVSGARGPCSMGTLQCTAGKAELVCVSPTTPSTETCNAVDDDCNGTVDDLPSLQTDVNNCGACGNKCPANNRCDAGKCVATTPPTGGAGSGTGGAGTGTGGAGAGAGGAGTGAGGAGTGAGGAGSGAAGMPEAGMPAAGAPPTAGSGEGGMSGGAGSAGMPMSMMMSMSCSPACSGGTTCCNGKCIDTSNDAMNCGGCGTVCSAGMQPACCGGKCVDLVSNGHCGACNKDCSLLSTSSITCTCTKNAQGTVACTGPLLNLCL